MKSWVRGGVVAVFVVALILVWTLTPLRSFADADRVAEAGRALRGSPWAPLITIGVFVLGVLVLFPLTPLLVMTAVVFPPLAAFAYCYGGALAGAALGYVLGRLLGQQRIGWLAGARAERLRTFLQRRGAAAIVIARLLPLGNFSVLNMLAGALGMPARSFALGNVVGLLPGIVVLTLLGDRLAAVLRHPRGHDIGLLLVVALLAGLGITWLRRRAARIAADALPPQPEERRGEP